MPESKSSPRRINARERQRQALELRKAGHSFEIIAQKLGYANRAGPAAAVRVALERITERPAAEVRKLYIERLDMFLLHLMPRIESGDPQAVNSALRIMVRGAKLLGLDAPEKLEAVVEHLDKRDYTHLTDEELDRALAEVDRILGGDSS